MQPAQKYLDDKTDTFYLQDAVRDITAFWHCFAIILWYRRVILANNRERDPGLIRTTIRIGNDVRKGIGKD